MKKIPVSEIQDSEGNIDSLKLSAALAKGGVTVYGMDMATIAELRRVYLQRGGDLPITRNKVLTVFEP